MNKLFGCLLVALLILTGCKKELTETRSSNRDGKFGIEYLDFTYLSSKAKFKYQNDKQKITATTTFRIKKDSLIWASISPGLGIEVARLLANRTEVQMLDKLKKDYYVYTYEGLSQLYGFEVSFELIEALVVGNALFEPKKKRQIKDDGRFYMFSREENTNGINQFIGKNSKKLERLIAYQTEANNSIVVNYGDFEKVGEHRAAQKIRARVKSEDKTKENIIIDIEYSRMEVQDEPLSFPFHVSSKYTRK